LRHKRLDTGADFGKALAAALQLIAIILKTAKFVLRKTVLSPIKLQQLPMFIRFVTDQEGRNGEGVDGKGAGRWPGWNRPTVNESRRAPRDRRGPRDLGEEKQERRDGHGGAGVTEEGRTTGEI
jgi:hypothetical protein